MLHWPPSKEQLSLFKVTLSLFKGHLYTLMMLKMSLLQRPNSKNCSKLLKPVPQLSQPSQLSQLHQLPPQSFHTEDTTVTTSEDTTVLDITAMLDTHTVHMLVITVHMLVMLVIHSVTFPTNS